MWDWGGLGWFGTILSQCCNRFSPVIFNTFAIIVVPSPRPWALNPQALLRADNVHSSDE